MVAMAHSADAGLSPSPRYRDIILYICHFWSSLDIYISKIE